MLCRRETWSYFHDLLYVHIVDAVIVEGVGKRERHAVFDDWSIHEIVHCKIVMSLFLNRFLNH